MQGGFCLEFVSERVDLLLRGHGLSAAGPACGADRLMERARGQRGPPRLAGRALPTALPTAAAGEGPHGPG